MTNRERPQGDNLIRGDLSRSEMDLKSWERQERRFRVVMWCVLASAIAGGAIYLALWLEVPDIVVAIVGAALSQVAYVIGRLQGRYSR